jgi:hypothetical protein
MSKNTTLLELVLLQLKCLKQEKLLLNKSIKKRKAIFKMCLTQAEMNLLQPL